MGTKEQALIVVPLIIGALCGVFGVLGYFIGSSLGVPSRLCLPLPLRASGAIVLALGFVFMGWLFKYRKPVEILTSTYVTLRKAIREAPAEKRPARTEPLVVKGPHRHVRHPLYFAVVALLLGWWLVLDYTFLLFMALLLLLWFNFVVIRFEEQELRVLFGEQYEAYAKAVPRIIPSFTWRWH